MTNAKTKSADSIPPVHLGEEHTLSLQAFESSELASEETLFFTGYLAVDGQRVAHVKNAGQGGMTFIRPLHQTGGAAEAVTALRMLAESYPPDEADAGFTLDATLERIVDDLAYLAHDVLRYKPHMGSKTYVLDGHQCIRYNRPPDEDLRSYIDANHDEGYTILNDVDWPVSRPISLQPAAE